MFITETHRVYSCRYSCSLSRDASLRLTGILIHYEGQRAFGTTIQSDVPEIDEVLLAMEGDLWVQQGPELEFQGRGAAKFADAYQYLCSRVGRSTLSLKRI